MISSNASTQVIQQWQSIPQDYDEVSLQANLANFVFQVGLGLHFTQLRQCPSLGTGSGLRPDMLVYTDLTKPPVLVIENKKRVAALATAPELATAPTNISFADLCKAHPIYQQAVGYLPNGIKQYLDKSNPKINPALLASYGLVFNGDFF